MLARLRALDADPRARTVLSAAIGLLLVSGVIGLTGVAPAPTASARTLSAPSGAGAIPAGPAPRSAQIAAALPGATASAPVPDTVTVQGVGSVTGTPDVLLLSLSVSVRRPSVAAALNAANAATKKLVSSLRGHGVAARDIQTTGLGVTTAYDYTDNTPKKLGYDASHSLTARLRGGTSKDGATISAAATSAGDDVGIDGLSFDLENNDSLITQARDRAFADARSKAQQYARLAGRSLGQVIGISEVSSTAPAPIIGAGAGAAVSAGASPVPVQTGSQAIGVVVTVTWALN